MVGISIIIPVYNTGKYLSELFKSILDLNIISRYEILIINDCSDDDFTLNYLCNLKNPKIRLFNLNVNRGVQHARNIGILNSKYSFITTIDSDDKYDINTIKNFKNNYIDDSIELLLNNDNIAFTHGFSTMFGDANGLTISSYPVNWQLILKKHHVPTFIVYRKEDVFNTVLYDEMVTKWQDWSFGVNILNSRFKRGQINKIYCFPFSVHQYRVHNDFIRISTKDVSELDMVKITVDKNKEIFSKYYGQIDNDIYRKILLNKPDRLTELLYVANHNLELALSIKNIRKYKLSASKISCIP